MRPEALRAIQTRDRQIDQLLADEANAVFQIGEHVKARDDAPFPYVADRVYVVHLVRHGWLQLAELAGLRALQPLGQAPGIGASYFRLVGDCGIHRGAWTSLDPEEKDLNGDGLGWHVCLRCDAILPEWPNTYWMHHSNAGVPLPTAPRPA